MKIKLILMLLASIAIYSCVPHERTQYKGERVTLIDIIERLRLTNKGDYEKVLVYVYRVDHSGYEFELDIPFGGSMIIGSRHVIPLIK